MGTEAEVVDALHRYGCMILKNERVSPQLNFKTATISASKAMLEAMIPQETIHPLAKFSYPPEPYIGGIESLVIDSPISNTTALSPTPTKPDIFYVGQFPHSIVDVTLSGDSQKFLNNQDGKYPIWAHFEAQGDGPENQKHASLEAVIFAWSQIEFADGQTVFPLAYVGSNGIFVKVEDRMKLERLLIEIARAKVGRDFHIGVKAFVDP